MDTKDFFCKKMLQIYDDLILYLIKSFDNLYDLVQFKRTCKTHHKLINIAEYCMIAKKKKVHLLRDSYNKMPCLRNFKILFPQMTHSTQLFTFQVGCNVKPVRIHADCENGTGFDSLHEDYHLLNLKLEKDDEARMHEFSNRIKNASGLKTLYVFKHPRILVCKNTTGHHKIAGKWYTTDLINDLHINLQFSKYVKASLILSLHISSCKYRSDIYEYPPSLIATHFIYFQVKEALTF